HGLLHLRDDAFLWGGEPHDHARRKPRVRHGHEAIRDLRFRYEGGGRRAEWTEITKRRFLLHVAGDADDGTGDAAADDLPPDGIFAWRVSPHERLVDDDDGRRASAVGRSEPTASDDRNPQRVEIPERDVGH